MVGLTFKYASSYSQNKQDNIYHTVNETNTADICIPIIQRVCFYIDSFIINFILPLSFFQLPIQQINFHAIIFPQSSY